MDYDGRSVEVNSNFPDRPQAMNWVEDVFARRLKSYIEQDGDHHGAVWYGKVLYQRGIPIGEVIEQDRLKPVGWQGIVYHPKKHDVSHLFDRREEAESWTLITHLEQNPDQEGSNR